MLPLVVVIKCTQFILYRIHKVFSLNVQRAKISISKSLQRAANDQISSTNDEDC
jgi:hypothetical protein